MSFFYSCLTWGVLLYINIIMVFVNVGVTDASIMLIDAVNQRSIFSEFEKIVCLLNSSFDESFRNFIDFKFDYQ